MLEARADGHGAAGCSAHPRGGQEPVDGLLRTEDPAHIEGNWTFVIVTDRVELDDQIAKTFKATGAVSQQESQVCHAGSGAELRDLLRGNHRYVFTLIHKFQTPEMLCDRPDVIVITTSPPQPVRHAGVNMRSALPKALFVAFTARR